MRRNVILLLVLCILFSGCLTGKMRKNLEKLEVGTPVDEVIDIMGPPYDNEILVLESGEKIEFYKYKSDYIIGKTLVPICIQNDRVVGWGREFYKEKKKGAKVLFP